jgi:hypothetical protein
VIIVLFIVFIYIFLFLYVWRVCSAIERFFYCILLTG